MIQINDEQLLTLSLMDQILDDLSPLSTFMKSEEYEKVYQFSADWKSKKWFLNQFFSQKLNLSKGCECNFPIRLYSMEKTFHLEDSLATIPYEFQYFKRRDDLTDIIVIRMYLNDTDFRIAIIEVTKDIVLAIEEKFQEIKETTTNNTFDFACFLFVQENAEKFLRKIGKIFHNWDFFVKKFEQNYQLSIKEYSDTGKYLWQIDYLCFDNRYQSNEEPFSLIDQYEFHRKKEEQRKKDSFVLKHLFKDEFGNYWKNKDFYLNYKMKVSQKEY